jgi:hypothetical protein
MEISKSLESFAVQALEGTQEHSLTLIAVSGTPFFLSETGEGIMAHGIVEHQGKRYYIGTIDPDSIHEN